MKLKTNIEIVTGFLGSGKTCFINALLNNTLVQGERVIVIQCETGETELDNKIKNFKGIIIKQKNPQEDLTEEFMKYIINLNSPHRIIIEQNGTREIQGLLDLFNKDGLKVISKISTIFNTVDSVTFNLYANNIGKMILEPIVKSDLIIINNTGKVSKKTFQETLNNIKAINPVAYTLEVPHMDLIEDRLKKEKILDSGISKKINTYLKNSFLT